MGWGGVVVGWIWLVYPEVGVKWRLCVYQEKGYTKIT